MSARRAIYNARIIDPATGTDDKGGVLIENGVIIDVGPGVTKATAADVKIDAKGKALAPGLIDLRVKTGEPGAENKETLQTASDAAAAGGVTTFVVMPDTDPVIDSVALVDFIKRRADGVAKVKVHPAAGLTLGLDGAKMSEIGLIREAGAAFFTNGDKPVEDAGVLRRAMSYAASFNALVASRPDTPALSKNTVMNAGAFAARLGLRGTPPEAEWIALERDLMLAETTGVRLLVDCISTARSLAAIERARRAGVKVSCSVASYSLFFNELDVGDYLTYCKVQPPFRIESDRMALIDGLKRGVIDAVVSAHDPQPTEDKRLPIADAASRLLGQSRSARSRCSRCAEPSASESVASRARWKRSGRCESVTRGPRMRAAVQAATLRNSKKFSGQGCARRALSATGSICTSVAPKGYAGVARSASTKSASSWSARAASEGRVTVRLERRK